MKLKIIPIAIILIILISPFAWAAGDKAADKATDKKIDEGKVIDKTKESKKVIADVPKELDGKIKVKDSDTSKYKVKKIKTSQIEVTKTETPGEHTKTTLSIDRDVAKGIDVDRDGIFGYARIVDGQVISSGTITLDELVAGITVTFSTNIVDGFSGSYTKTGSSQNVSQSLSLGQTFVAANTSAVLVNITEQSSSDPYTKIVAMSPKAWYKLDNTTGTSIIDSSGNGYTGTLVNGPTWVTGKYNNAVNFDGSNDYARIPITMSNTSGTIAMWGKMNVVSASKYSIGSIDASSNRIGLGLSASGKFAGILGSDTTSTITSSTSPVAGNWYLVILNYNQSAVRMVVNNNILYSGARHGTVSTSPILFGALNNSGSAYSYSNATRDNVLIFDRSLSMAEETDLFYSAVDGLQAKTNSNATYSTMWNSTSNNPLTVPVKSSDSDISSISFSVPNSVVQNSVRIYNYSSTARFTPTATILFTEAITLVSDTAGPIYFNVSINHTKQNTYPSGSIIYAIAPLYSSTPTFVTTNPNATIARNMTSFTISTGYVPSGSTYSYTISIQDDHDHGMWLNRVLQWMGSGFGFVGEPPTDYTTYIGDQIEVTVS